MAGSIVDFKNLSSEGQNNYLRALESFPGQAIVDFSALVKNMRLMRSRFAPAQVMGIVKANAYGHGLIPSCLAAIKAGCTWIGVAKAQEALAIRRGGINREMCRVLAWLANCIWSPYEEMIEADIDVALGSMDEIHAVAAAAKKSGKRARVHIVVDTGFSRNGFLPEKFEDALSFLKKLVEEGRLKVVGIMSHFSSADLLDSESEKYTDFQLHNFSDFVKKAERFGFKDLLKHISNSASSFSRPFSRFDMVRPGNSFYGYAADYSLGSPQDFGLIPALTLEAQLAKVKDVEGERSVSYGRAYKTEGETSLAIVPLGYADGILRTAGGSNTGEEKIGAPVRILSSSGPKIARACGKVCMDQFMIDLGSPAEELGIMEGDTVRLFGAGCGESEAEPTADDWARRAENISYVIYTNLSLKIPRLYLNAKKELQEKELSLLNPECVLS
ncbi:MAG: alanine racemase [Bifidobacteriaceae bacterium]|nr:alanine racemase [Bifidobacteriaceae bacterium]